MPTLPSDWPNSSVSTDLLAKVALYTDNYVIISDRQDRIIWINDSLVEKSGYSLEEIKGKKPGEVFRGEATDPDVAEAIDEAYRRGKEFECDIINYNSEGEPFWVNLAVNPVQGPGGAIEYYISIGRDITLQKKRSRKVEEARQKAEQMAREKQKIVSILSHDIKSPLSSILGSIDLLRDLVEGEDASQLLDVMHIASDNMMNLVKNMLEISRIEAGKFAINAEPADLKQLVLTTIQPLRVQANTTNNELVLEFDEALEGKYLIDPIRFSQLVNNLVNNAIKFTTDGRIRLVLKKLDGTGGSTRIRMEVHDTGSGIARDKQEAIFSRFNQAGASTEQKFEGTGLGLTIAKHIVEEMNGAIWLESDIGEGTTFFVEGELQVVPN